MSTAGDDVQLVTFRVGGQDFAFNIFQVERILRYETPVPLPKAPDFLEGVLQYQGSAVPLVDLRKRLGVEAPQREETRTVILEFDGGKIGLVVDTVNKVKEGRPHCVDHIKNGEIQLVINTVGDKVSQADSASIRRTALVQNVPYQTTMAGARATLMAIEAGLKRKLTVKPLQEYYAVGTKA